MLLINIGTGTIRQQPVWKCCGLLWLLVECVEAIQVLGLPWPRTQATFSKSFRCGVQPVVQSWQNYWRRRWITQTSKLYANCSLTDMIEVMLLTQWDFFVGSWSSVIFHWSVCIEKINKFFCTCGPSWEPVFESEWRATYFGSLRVKLILRRFGMPKWVWPSMNQYRMSSVQTSTLCPSMHRKLTEDGGCCMQNSQHPTKSRVWVIGY